MNAVIARGKGWFVKCMHVVLRCGRLPELRLSKGKQDDAEGVVLEHLSAPVSSVVGETGFHQLPVSSSLVLHRLNDPKMSEAERQSMESERADCSLFVQELLLSTLMREESSSSDEDERGEIADFGAMGCVDIMPLDVALENLNLKESNKGNEPPPPPL